MKLAAVIILYNPNKSLQNNIASYLNNVQRLYIIDNSVKPLNSLDLPYPGEKIKYLHDGTNQGIAKRLNEGVSYASKDGYNFLLTMDQDSCFQFGEFEKYLNVIRHYPDSKNVAMFGVALNSNSYPIIKNKNILITSGSIINLEITNKIGGFDENLFIDLVDTEFCIRAWKRGYTTNAIAGIKMDHELGENKVVWTKNIKKERRSIHSPSRIYYMIRNYLYTRKKHPDFKQFLRFKIIYNEIKNALLYSGKPIDQVLHILKAIIHSKKGKMGKQNSTI